MQNAPPPVFIQNAPPEKVVSHSVFFPFALIMYRSKKNSHPSDGFFFTEKLPGAQELFSKSGLFFYFLDLQILPKARLKILVFSLFCKKKWKKWILVTVREFFFEKKCHAKCPQTLKSVFSIFFLLFFKITPSDGFFWISLPYAR